MKSGLVARLQQLNGWRLWLLFSGATVLVAVFIVSVMDLLLMGRVTVDYLLTGLVTAGIVAPASLFLMSTLLREIAGQQQQDLSHGVESAEVRLRAALDSTDEGILMVAADGRVLSANKRFFELWRVPQELVAVGQDDLLLAHVLDQLSDPDEFLAGVQRLYGSDAQANDTLRFKDGRVFERYTRTLDLGAEQGRIWCFRDVSVQAHTREALAEREEHYRAIVNQAGDGIDLIDAETLRFLEVNEAACRMLGYRRDELVGQSLAMIQAWLDEAALRDAVAEVVRDGKADFENRHRCKDGRVLDVYVNTRAIRLRGRTCLVGVWRDIGERKVAEEALRQSRNLLQTIIDTAPMRVFWKDKDLRYLGCNPAFARDAGKTHPEELVGKDDFAMAWAEQAELYRADDRAVMASGVSRLSFDEPQTTPDGGTLWLRTSKVPLLNSDSQTIGILGIYEDITERKLAEIALREREEIFSAVINRSVEGILLIDAETMEFAEFNDAACKGLGYTREEFSRLRLPDVQGSISPEETLAKCRVAANTPGGLSFENWHRCKDGSLRERHVSNRPVDVRGRVYLAHVWHDVTEQKRAAQALTDSALFLRETQSIALVGGWKANPATDMLLWTEEVYRLVEHPLDSPPRGLEEGLRYYAPEYLPEIKRLLSVAWEQGTPFTFETEMIAASGRRFWAELRCIGRVEAESGVYVAGTLQDITARKQAEAELEGHRRHLEELVERRTSELLATEGRAMRILDSAADGLYGVDSDSRITFINPAACRMLGYSVDQAMGRSAHELFHHSHADGSPYPAAECRARQAWRAGRESRVDDETYWHADGHAIPVTLASHPIIEKGEIVGAVMSIVDTTVLRAAAQAREKALIAAENLARARSEFLANMSHEIRTPMNGVLGFAQIGRRNYTDPEKVRNAFDKILTSGNQLLGVVNEILDFSKIDAGKLQVEASEMVLGDALDNALELVADRARAKGLDVRLEKAADLPPICISDPLRLGQVLLNLLTNAVKFTETGSVVLSASRQGEQLVFRVTDTGIGMTAEQLGYVFNPFQQADGSTTRMFGGTGLGLAICKRLLELMQGEIRVESTPGAGSRFEVRLPYVEPAAHPAAAPATPVTLPDKPLAGISILLAEDDPINQLVLEVNLEDDGARLVIVGDGATAVERVIADGPKAYDVVLMDLQMPLMNGYEATRRILELVPGLPIIGQTAHAFDEDRDKCLAAGMVGHIAKPIDPQALVKLVLRVLAEKRRE